MKTVTYFLLICPWRAPPPYEYAKRMSFRTARVGLSSHRPYLMHSSIVSSIKKTEQKYKFDKLKSRTRRTPNLTIFFFFFSKFKYICLLQADGGGVFADLGNGTHPQLNWKGGVAFFWQQEFAITFATRRTYSVQCSLGTLTKQAMFTNMRWFV